MFCSGCGQAITPGQGFCQQCGRPVAPVTPPMPGFGVELDSYDRKVKALAILWFVYAGLTMLVGFAGVAFLKAFFFGGFGPWMHPWVHGNAPPEWLFPMIMPVVWTFLVLRTGLAIAAGWGLLQRAQWGRIVAIIAAIFSILKFPFGTALGIGTLVVLLGYRNSTLYEHLGGAASSY